MFTREVLRVRQVQFSKVQQNLMISSGIKGINQVFPLSWKRRLKSGQNDRTATSAAQTVTEIWANQISSAAEPIRWACAVLHVLIPVFRKRLRPGVLIWHQVRRVPDDLDHCEEKNKTGLLFWDALWMQLNISLSLRHLHPPPHMHRGAWILALSLHNKIKQWFPDIVDLVPLPAPLPPRGVDGEWASNLG